MEYSGNGSISSKRSKQLEWRLDRKSGIMPDMHSGLVAHIQRFSLHDGPGIRTTRVSKRLPVGLPVVPQSGEPVIAAGGHGRREPLRSVRPVRPRLSETLRGCSQRSRSPAGGCLSALRGLREGLPGWRGQMVGRQMAVSEVLDEIRRDTIFYDDSQGGVTFSGGEPLAQPAFLEALLSACTAEGIHTAVDTCGFAPTKQILAMAARGSDSLRSQGSRR